MCYVYAARQYVEDQFWTFNGEIDSSMCLVSVSSHCCAVLTRVDFQQRLTFFLVRLRVRGTLCMVSQFLVPRGH